MTTICHGATFKRNDINPCPFCGKSDEVYMSFHGVWHDDEGKPRKIWAIGCGTCRVKMGGDADKKGLINRWNGMG